MHYSRNPPLGKLCRSALLPWPTKVVNPPFKWGAKPRVAGRMGNVKDSTRVLSIANEVGLRRTKVTMKKLNIDESMEYGQSQLLGWDHLAEVKEDLLGKPLDGRLLLMVWHAKGRGPPLHHSIDVMGWFACPV